VDVRRVDRLVLATQQPGRLAGQPAEDDVGGVDDMPLTLDLAGLRLERAHVWTFCSRVGASAEAEGRRTERAPLRLARIPSAGRAGQNRGGWPVTHRSRQRTLSDARDAGLVPDRLRALLDRPV